MTDKEKLKKRVRGLYALEISVIKMLNILIVRQQISNLDGFKNPYFYEIAKQLGDKLTWAIPLSTNKQKPMEDKS